MGTRLIAVIVVQGEQMPNQQLSEIIIMLCVNFNSIKKKKTMENVTGGDFCLHSISDSGVECMWQPVSRQHARKATVQLSLQICTILLFWMPKQSKIGQCLHILFHELFNFLNATNYEKV